MKKMILMAIIMMATTTAFAQHEAGDVTIQSRIGFSAADFNNTGDTEARVGLIVGGEYEYYLSSRFSIAAGLNYSQQGSKLKDTDAADLNYFQPGSKLKDTDVTWKLDYLTVPVVANFYLFKGFAIKAGLQPAFKSKAEMEVKGDVLSGNADLKDHVKSFDLSVPVGLSYEFKRFVLDARYNFGLTNIFDKETDFDTKNLAFQLTLGYKFDL